MTIIGENIAKLRKERGMTQENLAEAMGVSPQTISKWENNTTCPDVMLLPILADYFGVTVDMLYGRQSRMRGIPCSEVLDAAMDRVYRTIVRCFNHDVDGPYFETEVKKLKYSLSSGEWTSVIENDEGGVVFLKEPVGALLLRRPKDGWNSLFQNDGNLSVLKLLVDEDFRKAMAVILKNRMLTFTLPALMKKAGIEDGEKLERSLLESRAFTCKTLTIDETELRYFELTGGENLLYMLFAALTYAQAYADDKNKHCYFVGNMNYFTP